MSAIVTSGGLSHFTVDEEIDRLRRQYLNNLKVSLGQPGAIARFAAARLVYRDAPYGHPLSGTPESLPRIKRDDITRLHGMFYRPDNAILVIGGDITPENGFAMAQKYFGDWQRPATELPRMTMTWLVRGCADLPSISVPALITMTFWA